MNIGISVDDIDLLVEPVIQPQNTEPVYKTLTSESILSVFKSGIGLDIAKNHTGVSIWRDGVLTTQGFAIDMEYEKTDYMAEAKMRLEFKRKLTEILQGYDWEVCVVEDVYGGTNFDTTRKLLALNCVVDELALEGIVSIEHIYRLKEAEWMRSLRQLTKAGRRLNSKYECQAILEYINFPFYLENKDKTDTYKKSIFFEDRCDATGQLLALALKMTEVDNGLKSSSVKLSNVYMEYFEDDDDIYLTGDKVLCEANILVEEYPEGVKNVESVLLEFVEKNPDYIIMMRVQNVQLGTFGIANGFTYYEQGFGYLVFYDKSLRRKYK